MKGETMVVHACFVAILIGAAAGKAADTPPSRKPDVLVAKSQALIDMQQVCVILAAPETGPVEPWIEIAKLKAQVVEKLSAGGIKAAEKETGRVPKLVVQIEGIVIPDSDTYAYRVQTSLSRLVTVPARKDMEFEAHVWQTVPVMQAVAKADAGNAIAAAVMTQAEAFVSACKAARGLPDLAEAAKQKKSASEPLNTAPPGEQNLQAASAYPFIASKSGSVFHRPGCRWAQNITGGNLVGYKSREEAVQAGKRPCKSCQP
jgi:hypothetical protein